MSPQKSIAVTGPDWKVCLAQPISLPRTLNFSHGSSRKIFVNLKLIQKFLKFLLFEFFPVKHPSSESMVLFVTDGIMKLNFFLFLQAVSFVLPSACDLHLTSNEKGWLNAIIFVGMMVGGYSFGGVADIKVLENCLSHPTGIFHWFLAVYSSSRFTSGKVSPNE